MNARAQALLATYCRAVDSGDRTLLSTVFAEDAVLNRPDGSSYQGRAAVVDLFAGTAAGPGFMRHYVLNVETEKGPDGNVQVRARYLCPVSGPTGSRVTLGHYEDVIGERDGSLQIISKRIFVDAVFTVPGDAVKIWATS